MQKFNVRFILRILFAIHLDKNILKGLDQSTEIRFNCNGLGALVTNYSQFKPYKIKEFESISEYITTLDNSKVLINEFDRVLIMCMSACNSMTISDHDGPIGGAIYDQLCLINHSCDPNACIVFDGPKASLFATRY